MAVRPGERSELVHHKPLTATDCKPRCTGTPAPPAFDARTATLKGRPPQDRPFSRSLSHGTPPVDRHPRRTPSRRSRATTAHPRGRRRPAPEPRHLLYRHVQAQPLEADRMTEDAAVVDGPVGADLRHRHQVRQTRGPLRGYRPLCRHQRVVVTYWSDDNSNTLTRRPPVGLTVSRTGCIPSLAMIRSEASLPT